MTCYLIKLIYECLINSEIQIFLKGVNRKLTFICGTTAEERRRIFITFAEEIANVANLHIRDVYDTLAIIPFRIASYHLFANCLKWGQVRKPWVVNCPINKSEPKRIFYGRPIRSLCVQWIESSQLTRAPKCCHLLRI